MPAPVYYVSVIQASPQEEIIVTGTRAPIEANRLPAAVTVINRQDIEEMQVNSLPELLTGIAGVDVTVSGGYGKTTGIRMRGTESHHVLVLVDGVRIGSATLGTRRLPTPAAGHDRAYRDRTRTALQPVGIRGPGWCHSPVYPQEFG